MRGILTLIMLIATATSLLATGPDSSVAISPGTWSFGINYVPLWRTVNNLYLDSNYGPYYETNLPYIYVTHNGETAIDADWQYAYTSRVQFLGRLEIGGNRQLNREKSQVITHINSPPDSSHAVQVDDKASTTVRIDLGAKYYFRPTLIKHAVPYIELTGGKQFAWATVQHANPEAIPDPTVVITNNQNEFLQNLLSPWVVTLGFGAEYRFAEWLAITAKTSVSYSEATSDYFYYSSNPYGAGSRDITYKIRMVNRDIISRTGVGLRFYF